MTTIYHAALTRLFVAIADACDRVAAALRALHRAIYPRAWKSEGALWLRAIDACLFGKLALRALRKRAIVSAVRHSAARWRAEGGR